MILEEYSDMLNICNPGDEDSTEYCAGFYFGSDRRLKSLHIAILTGNLSQAWLDGFDDGWGYLYD